MKVISPGVVALKPFKIHTNALTQDMIDFWVMMGAEAQVVHDEYHTHRSGTKQDQYYRLRMGGGDWSHKFNDGSNHYLLHFREEFAPEASIFILKFLDNIINHDIKVNEYDNS